MSTEDLIPQSDAAKMQQHAASKPSEVQKIAQPSNTSEGVDPVNVNVSDANEPATRDTPAFNKISIGVMVTLDTTRGELFEDHADELKNALSKYEPENTVGQSHNLFNPFKGVNAKVRAKDPDAARGLIRDALTHVFDIAAEVEDQNIMFLGKRSDIVGLLRKTASSLQTRVESVLGIAPETVIASITHTDEETGTETPTPVLFRDIVRVASWANTSSDSLALTEANEPSFTSHIFINLIVNVGSLYSATELDKQVAQISNYLDQAAKKYEEQTEYGPTVLLGVNMRANTLADERYFDLVGALGQRAGWDLFDRHDLVEAAKTNAAEWVPPSKAQIETSLLAPTGDLLFLAILPEDEEGEETEEG